MSTWSMISSAALRDEQLNQSLKWRQNRSYSSKFLRNLLKILKIQNAMSHLGFSNSSFSVLNVLATCRENDNGKKTVLGSAAQSLLRFFCIGLHLGISTIVVLGILWLRVKNIFSFIWPSWISENVGHSWSTTDYWRWWVEESQSK